MAVVDVCTVFYDMFIGPNINIKPMNMISTISLHGNQTNMWSDNFNHGCDESIQMVEHCANIKIHLNLLLAIPTKKLLRLPIPEILLTILLNGNWEQMQFVRKLTLHYFTCLSLIFFLFFFTYWRFAGNFIVNMYARDVCEWKKSLSLQTPIE